MKKIIGLTGHIASGKEVTKKYLENNYKAKSVKFSQILRDVLTRLNISIERKTMQDLSTSLRSVFGEDILAKNIAKDAENLDAEIVVLDGVRRLADIEYAKKLNNFTLIKIEASAELRYERMKTRNENEGDSEKTFDEFLKDHESESDKDVSIVIEEATVSIDNNGTIEDLYRQIDEIIKTI